jgi:hypothetical protein
MVGHRWGITGGGGVQCGWRLGAERREEKRGGERSGETGGWCSPFIGAGEGHAGRERRKRPAVMALTPLKAGWLNEGLRGD